MEEKEKEKGKIEYYENYEEREGDCGEKRKEAKINFEIEFIVLQK